ncbi:MAG TPA: histidine kinase [Gaiellaceae bacterium]|nr:histidine kinase [Gaiellaceae bacterium]
MARLELLVRRSFFDLVVVAVAVVLQGDVWTAEEPRWEVALGALLVTLPLLLRRRFGIAAVLVPVAALAAMAVHVPEGLSSTETLFFAALLVAWTAGHLEERRHALAGLVALVGAGLLVTSAFPGHAYDEYLWISVIFTATWLASYLAAKRGRQARSAEARARILELEREAEARAAVAEERARIARELHDVIAHSVSVMTVQAAGVRRLLKPDQEREREALEAIEQTGRAALAEMRRMLGVLRQPTEEPPALAPQPGLANLESLVAQVRDAGLPVELRVTGERPELPPGIELSAYRVVQEALTNALQHAGPARAVVDVRYTGDAIELEIANDGRTQANGHGHGLLGMRERVLLCGGSVEAGPSRRGYAVRARIPVRGEAGA